VLFLSWYTKPIFKVRVLFSPSLIDPLHLGSSSTTLVIHFSQLATASPAFSCLLRYFVFPGLPSVDCSNRTPPLKSRCRSHRLTLAIIVSMAGHAAASERSSIGSSSLLPSVTGPLLLPPLLSHRHRSASPQMTAAPRLSPAPAHRPTAASRRRRFELSHLA
jgi:hypothetical protein